MQVSIDNFIKKIKNPIKEKQFLKKCFLTDIKAKQINRFPSSFLILEYNFSQRDVLFASKIYLDKYATKDEKERYYQVLESYLKELSLHSKKIYLNYKKSFYTFLEC